jgi:tRNA dimethylallyltransferase
MRAVKHYLIDKLSITEPFSVNDYCTMANETVLDVLKRNKLPIICGGTGQYIEWFLKGIKLTSVPSDQELRKKLELEYDTNGAEAMHQKLKTYPISCGKLDSGLKTSAQYCLFFYNV